MLANIGYAHQEFSYFAELYRQMIVFSVQYQQITIFKEAYMSQVSIQEPFLGIVNGTHTIAEEYQELPIASPSLLARNVTWIRNGWNGSVSEQLLVTAALCTQIALLTLSIIGLYFLYEGYQEFTKQKTVEEYLAWTATLTPPKTMNIEVTTKTEAKNHVSEFIIHKDALWTKRIGADKSEWKPLYYSGYAQGRKPAEIHADGRRLILIDDQNGVEKKDTLEEYWLKNFYHFRDVSTEANWEDTWCTLPVLGTLINHFITGKKLVLPEYAAISLSDRGVFNRRYEDGAKKEHLHNGGSYTLYVLNKDGTEITMYDAWVPTNKSYSIPTPQSTKRPFNGISIASSASLVMTIGYESSLNSSKLVKKDLKIYTQFVDFDTMGWNPFLADTHDPHDTHAHVQVLPQFKWICHTLPNLRRKACITSHIEVVQTDQGNNARQLKITGKNELGEYGFYYKAVNEKEWHFHKTKHVPRIKALPVYKVTEETNLDSPVATWKSDDMSLHNFGPSSVHGSIHFKVAGKSVRLRLHRRENPVLKTVNFPKAVYYDLIRPENLDDDVKEEFEKTFGSDSDTRVLISFKENTLTITPKKQWSESFTYTLTKK